MGGKAVSLAVNYTHKKEFAKAGYQAFVIEGREYGTVRQYGNFSFLKLYERGHEVPYFQRMLHFSFPSLIYLTVVSAII
jgi:carboxypeptidase C (cathepsin A)